MSRTSAGLKLVVAAAALALPIGAHAQTFKVDKFNIGGEGGFDYVSVDPAGRVFVSRGTHMMVVDGMTGKVLGDIPNTPRVHGAAFSPKSGFGFTTNGGDSTVTMFALNDLSIVRRIHAGINGLDGIMFDDGTDRIFTSNHSGATRGATGTLTAIDAKTGEVIGNVPLAGVPEGAVSDGNGMLFVNLEDKNQIEMVDARTLKSKGTWAIAPCDGPTGIGIDRKMHRLFVGCSKTSVVVDSKTGKVVAQITNGDNVDALSYDPDQQLIYIPSGEGKVTVVKAASGDKYNVVAEPATMRGARTIGLDVKSHRAYVFTPEYGPAPTPPAGSPPPAGRGGPRGPLIGAWFFAMSH